MSSVYKPLGRGKDLELIKELCVQNSLALFMNEQGKGFNANH